MTTPSSSTPSSRTASRPWWRFGMVWMVLGGPAVVVVASLFTYYLAARAPDPVLTPQPGAGASAEDISQAPAVTGRNHAATGEVPAKATAPMASAP